jgi:hypothetical protein
MKIYAMGARAAALAGVFCAAAFGQTLSPELKAKVEAKAKLLQSWSTDPAIVAAVKARNAAPPAEAAGMTNDKWKSLIVLDPFVLSLERSPLALHLKSKKDDQISECFVSAADGTKAAFLTKTTSWTHADKDKHRVPMTGKTYIGPLEVDQSTGVQSVQVGLPVLDGAKPIGSIVVGVAVAKL